MAKKTVKQSLVASMMETFIKEGTYSQMKHTEAKIDQLTSAMKQRLEKSEMKRHEFSKYKLVGRFTAKKVYETDYVSLNEFLYDIGLLIHVVEINNKKIKTNELYLDMIKPFQLEDTFYVKPNFNKAGNQLNQLPATFKVTDQWGITDMARSLAILKPQEKALIKKYDKFKWKLLKTDEIQQMMNVEKRSTIPHQFGSISLMINPAKYDVPSIYEHFGEGLLIDYGIPNAKLLDLFIQNGTISKKDIDQFKTVKDIRLDFSVMTLEDEQKILNILDEKNRIAAINRMGA